MRKPSSQVIQPNRVEKALLEIRRNTRDLDSLDTFISAVHSRIEKLYAVESSARGTDHRVKAAFLSRQLDSAANNCKQVHAAASQLEAIKPYTWEVDEYMNYSNHRSRIAKAVKATLGQLCFDTPTDTEHSLRDLVSEGGQIDRKTDRLLEYRVWLKQPRRGTIDTASRHVVSFGKPSSRLPSIFGKDFVTQLSWHCRHPPPSQEPAGDDALTEAQQHRLESLKSFSNRRSLACRTMENAISGIQPVLDPNYPPELSIFEEMRRLDADFVEAKRILAAVLTKAKSSPGDESAKVKDFSSLISLDSSQAPDLLSTYLQSFERYVTDAGYAYPEQVLKASQYITATIRRPEQTEAETNANAKKRQFLFRTIVSTNPSKRSAEATEAWYTRAQLSMFPGPGIVEPSHEERQITCHSGSAPTDRSI